MSRKTCETCGSRGKDNDLLPDLIIPEMVTAFSDFTVSKITTLCANCRKEIGDWYNDRVHEKRYKNEIGLLGRFGHGDHVALRSWQT